MSFILCRASPWAFPFARWLDCRLICVFRLFFGPWVSCWPTAEKCWALRYTAAKFILYLTLHLYYSLNKNGITRSEARAVLAWTTRAANATTNKHVDSSDDNRNMDFHNHRDTDDISSIVDIEWIRNIAQHQWLNVFMIFASYQLYVCCLALLRSRILDMIQCGNLDICLKCSMRWMYS